MLSSTGRLPHCTETIYIMAKKRGMMKQQSISFPKQDSQAIRCLLVTFPPQSAIRHQRVRGQEIHQNSLCSVRYTKEPLRIRDGLLCLWPSTLRPIPSSPSLLGVNSSTIPAGWHGKPSCTHSLSLCSFVHTRGGNTVVVRMYFSYNLLLLSEYIFSFSSACVSIFGCQCLRIRYLDNWNFLNDMFTLLVPSKALKLTKVYF